MTAETLLLRQVHPSFVQNGRATSQAFRPTPKDESRLSVDNGDRVSPDVAWRRFSDQPDCSSFGVMAISKGECSTFRLEVVEDGTPYPEHCYLNFSLFSRKDSEKISKRLAALAHLRGWLFEAE